MSRGHGWVSWGHGWLPWCHGRLPSATSERLGAVVGCPLSAAGCPGPLQSISEPSSGRRVLTDRPGCNAGYSRSISGAPRSRPGTPGPPAVRGAVSAEERRVRRGLAGGPAPPGRPSPPRPGPPRRGTFMRRRWARAAARSGPGAAPPAGPRRM